jgi:hypothetical protein
MFPQATLPVIAFIVWLTGQLFAAGLAIVEMEVQAWHRLCKRGKGMDGIQFLVNENGEKTAVLLDLKQWGDLWEDVYDILVSRSRDEEETVSWDELEAELDQENEPNDAV